MAPENISEIRRHIFSEIKKKAGNIDIYLAMTPNGKARITIGNNRKDFVNQRDALEWLIHSYNLKHLKNILFSSRHQTVDINIDMSNRRSIEDAANEIFETMIEFDYYSTEIYRNAISDFDRLKTERGFSPEEIEHVYKMVTESLKKLLDQTFHVARYQVYKKYLDQLSMRNSKRESRF